MHTQKLRRKAPFTHKLSMMQFRENRFLVVKCRSCRSHQRGCSWKKFENRVKKLLKTLLTRKLNKKLKWFWKTVHQFQKIYYENRLKVCPDFEKKNVQEKIIKNYPHNIRTHAPRSFLPPFISFLNWRRKISLNNQSVSKKNCPKNRKFSRNFKRKLVRKIDFSKLRTTRNRNHVNKSRWMKWKQSS